MRTKRNVTKRGRAANGAGTLVLRGNTYHARWYADGHIISRSTGTGDIDEARAWLERHSVARTGLRDREAVTKLARLMSASLDDSETRLRTLAITPGQLFELFRDAPSRPDVAAVTLEGYRQQLDGLAAWIAREHPEITSVRDISQTVADEYATARAKTVSANRLNKDLNLFASVWRALARKYGLEYNPWTSDRIARRRHQAAERRALTDEEVRALLDNSTDELHLMVLLAISTGLRLGDIVNLRWNSLDLERAEIAIRRTRKTGAPIALPLVPELHRALLEASARRSCEWVLPDHHARMERDASSTQICREIRRLFARANIEMRPADANGDRPATPVASFHSLRHTFVTRLMRRGISPALIQAAVGHSTMMMTEHYTHISADDLARGLAENKSPEG